jgi:hypothetical protein
MIDNISLLVWQTKELCYAFPGRLIDVRAGCFITNNQQYQDFEHRLLTLGLYVNYDEKYNYHNGYMSYDTEDCRIRVSTDVITRPASDFPGGSYDGPDDVLRLDAQYAYFALCKYDSNYVINIDKMKHNEVSTYVRDYAIQMQIEYPLKNISVCTESNHKTSYTYNKDGGTVTERRHVTTTRAPIVYKAKYTEEELDLLVNATAQSQNSQPTKRLKIGL